MSSRQKQVSLVLLCLAALFFRAEGQLNTIVTKISDYNRSYPEEVLHMYMDREICHPGVKQNQNFSPCTLVANFRSENKKL